jgi:hypothetical protein
MIFESLQAFLEKNKEKHFKSIHRRTDSWAGINPTPCVSHTKNKAMV